jgi:hypothetical protein
MSYKQNITEEQTGLKVGGKYTLLSVSDFMANTLKSEIEITGFRQEENYAQYKNLLVVMFKQKGKRKKQGFYLKDSDTFLNGWDLNIHIDSDTGKGFKGNALINLNVQNINNNQEILTLRDLINRCFVYGNKGIFFYSDLTTMFNSDGIPLFFLDAEQQQYNHAIVKRALDKIKPITA